MRVTALAVARACPSPTKGSVLRKNRLVLLAVTAAVAPAVAQAAESVADADAPSGARGGRDPQALREGVLRLGERARVHSARLGLEPPAAPAPAPAATTGALARQHDRLRVVVGFLSRRDELDLAVDERPVPPAVSRGRSLASRVAHQHRLATRAAVRLGLAPPAPLRLAGGRDERIAQLARWRAVSRWLTSRSERRRAAERPMSQRVPHYEAFTCIADHESGGRWDISTGNGYYGGLQMDRGFQRTYAPGLYARKGTADNWTKEEQIRAAGRAVKARGFTPWPATARVCGLL
jgi:hypothetical protein